MNRATKRRIFAAVIAVGLGAGGLVASRSDAAGGPKTYTAAATSAKLNTGPQTAGITLTNTSRNKISFNAVNITVPAGLTVSGPLSLGSAPGSATVNGSTIELRDLSTPSGAALTVTFQVAATVSTICQAYEFVSDVRQSNDFNGINNEFALVGSYAVMTGPCSSASVICTAGDGQICQTGLIESSNGDTASVVVNESDTLSATLTASLEAGALTCAEYAPTSDKLVFDLDPVGSPDLTGVTKTVQFSQHYDGVMEDWEYQACFQAPYDFPALLPSQLAEDFAHSDFSGNTTEAPAGTFTGLLLPCGAGYGVPCLLSTVIDVGGAGTADDTVTITVDVPALDPGMRF